jgi:hypothetical protein
MQVCMTRLHAPVRPSGWDSIPTSLLSLLLSLVLLPLLLLLLPLLLLLLLPLLLLQRLSWCLNPSSLSLPLSWSSSQQDSTQQMGTSSASELIE